jgi:hypothetical protein
MDNTTSNHTTPVELAIDLFGGVRKLARALNRDPAAVSRWQKSGVVPTSVQRRLLESAWERGIEISAHDIVFGREVND